MTRETKIGLLVGLSFIIVVGILLSDHIADSNRPPQALLSDVGNNVRNSVAIPQPAVAQPTAPAPTQVATTAGPNAPLPTQEELRQTSAPAPADNVIVNVGPGGNATPLTQPTPVANTNQTANGVGGTTMPLIAVDQPPADKNSPASDNSGVTPISLSEANSSSDANAKILKQYTVAKGDTLGKLAHRFYGTSSHAAVEAILNANPQLKGNAARLAVGKTYNIPVFAKGEQAASVAKDSRQSKEKFAMVDTNTLAVEPTTKPAAQALASKTRNHAVAGSSYTVKSGDTFWKIASRELGSRRQWKQIEELNPGALHHGQLKVGTVLKLPAKTVATAD